MLQIVHSLGRSKLDETMVTQPPQDQGLWRLWRLSPALSPQMGQEQGGLGSSKPGFHGFSMASSTGCLPGALTSERTLSLCEHAQMSRS